MGVAGAFGFSIAFGYLLYQVYDIFFYERDREELILSYDLLLQWASTRIRPPGARGGNDLRLVMLRDYALYVSPRENPLDSKIIDTIRGYWNHVQARTVSVLAIIPAFALFLLSCCILSQFQGTLVFRLDQLNLIRWVMLLLDLIIIFLCILVLLLKRKRTIKEADHLASFVLRHNHKAVCKMLDILHQEEVYGIAEAFRKRCADHSEQ